MRPALTCASVVLALGCADPCADVTGPPSLTLAGASDTGDTLETFDDGADRPLISGPQIGMHIWLNVRTTGLCPTQTQVDRRVVVDATNEIVDLQLGPVRFDESDELGTFTTASPFTMFMCPSAQTIVDTRFRFMVRVEDADGRVATAEKPFVAVCASGACDICDSM